MTRVAVAALLALLALLVLIACSDDDGGFRCDHGKCYCDEGRDCEIPCGAPPCSVECAGAGTSCTADCANGICTCGPGSSCAFECDSPPCHVDCAPGTECSGTCANGTCTCARGAACELECQSGPCHVQCAGDNPYCNGTCANGSCTCGPGSTCRFACLDHNCSVACERGSSCVLECSSGRAGEPGCEFRSCAAGEQRVCAGSSVVTCGAPCPEDEER